MKDLKIFRTIKQLEERRAIPTITKENGDNRFDHQIISNMITEQLKLSKEKNQ